MPATALTDLPPELIQQIASYLPSASSIIALDLTCRKLHGSIASDGYRVFREFVLNRFPSISCPPLWREAARALTTRSRAWDRKAFVGRVLVPEPSSRESRAMVRNANRPRRSMGYVPALDSYEEWNGGNWASRNQALAWGAGPLVVLRRMRKARPTDTEGKVTQDVLINGVRTTTHWTVVESQHDASPQQDILDLYLLKPEQREGDAEQFIFRRANHEISKIQCNANEDICSAQGSFDTGRNPCEAMDLSPGSKPLLAVCHHDSIRLYLGNSTDSIITPDFQIPRSQDSPDLCFGRSLKFITPERFALAENRLHDMVTSPIRVYQMDNASASETSLIELETGSARERARIPTALAPIMGEYGHVFLAGWSDGVIRLHDDRAPSAVTEFSDTVDDGMIASILSIGKDSFIAGGHQNACLKLFDIRRPGSRPYSYLNSRNRWQPTKNSELFPEPRWKAAMSHPATDVNVLLAIRLGIHTRIYAPLMNLHGNDRNNRHDRSLRYRGSIYSLSMPSPSSRTIFAGIENHVLQLDLASTDDILNHRLDYDWGLDLDVRSDIELSGYARPPPPGPKEDQFVSEAKVELRHLRPLNSMNVDMLDRSNVWDDRWQVAEYERRGGRDWMS